MHNKSVDGPCIASRLASISCRGSEGEFFLNVEENLLLKWRTGPYHAVPCKRSASAAGPDISRFLDEDGWQTTKKE